MCLALYIGSNLELNESAWNKNEPHFYIETVPAGNKVKKQFSTPFVYYAGSHEGCGCGFFKEGRESEELQQAQENYSNLVKTIEQTINEGEAVQLFSCWEGDQGRSPEVNKTISLFELVAPEFEFQELQFLNVVKNA